MARLTGWAAKCSEEGVRGGAGVVAKAGLAVKCAAKEAVFYDAGMVITTLSSVKSTVKDRILVCLRFAATTGSVETCSVTDAVVKVVKAYRNPSRVL